jgi:hypothetical protein
MLLAILVFVGNVAAAEPSGRKQSNLEALLVNNETLLQSDSYDMGEMSGSLDVKFTAMVVTDPVKAEVVARGMKVTILGEKEVTSTVYLDQEELEALGKAIGVIKATAVKFADQKREPYTELAYTSKGGFKFGYLNKGAGAGMFSSSSALFIRTPELQSLLKDDEKRIAQMQTIVNNVMLRTTRK